jgi:hypothetical protein
LKPWLAALRLFFDQAFLRSHKAALSTFLLEAKRRRIHLNGPVDKSVVKLWKDSAKGRRYWLGAIVGLTARSEKWPWATQQANWGQAKKFQNPSLSLVDSGLQLFYLPPETVDRPVDKVRAYGYRPRLIWLSCC